MIGALLILDAVLLAGAALAVRRASAPTRQAVPRHIEDDPSVAIGPPRAWAAPTWMLLRDAPRRRRETFVIRRRAA